MTDRELLEAAAKAAGIVAEPGHFCPLKGLFRGFKSNGYTEWPEWWNPLTDDGDALRLAVKLIFSIEQSRYFRRVAILVYLDSKALITEREFFEPWGDDKSAATRLAIVRAAAAIGTAS